MDSAASSDKAAAEAGVEISVVESPADARDASALFGAVWPMTDGDSPARPEMIRALVHAGNYVSVARRGSSVVGAALAFRGRGGTLHSHLAGVIPGLEGRHVGFALKLHQRAWSLAEGIDIITWTFDPLVGRNGYFNVTKLGASLPEFLVDFYGPLDDGLNAGSPSDRCLVVWDLRSPVVEARASGERGPAPMVKAPLVLWPGPGGEPVRKPGLGPVRVPDDIVALRAAHPALAEEWRLAVRDVFVASYASGKPVTAVTSDGTYLF